MLGTRQQQILVALITEIERQGRGNGRTEKSRAERSGMNTYHISRAIDLVAIASAIDEAISLMPLPGEEGKTPEELNSANDD
jgi:hypothetical protein